VPGRPGAGPVPPCAGPEGSKLAAENPAVGSHIRTGSLEEMHAPAVDDEELARARHRHRAGRRSGRAGGARCPTRSRPAGRIPTRTRTTWRRRSGLLTTSARTAGSTSLGPPAKFPTTSSLQPPHVREPAGAVRRHGGQRRHHIALVVRDRVPRFRADRDRGPSRGASCASFLVQGRVGRVVVA
jgi:hypothetical protein